MDSRTAAQIREHYEIEKTIARKLRESGAEERRSLYTAAYDELFQRVPHHPLLHNETREANRVRITREVSNLEPLLTPGAVYLEIGPGDCGIAFEVARRVRKVYAIDVSEVVTARVEPPPNFELIISNGVEIPVPDESIDIAYSNQLMEHLHPDDSLAQLREIYRVLKSGGRYYCVTPNRLSGPHDISRDFDNVATCLHLREFTVSELDSLFREVGFVRRSVFLRFRGYGAALPVWPFRVLESAVAVLPHRMRRILTFNKAVRFVLGVKLIGVK